MSHSDSAAEHLRVIRNLMERATVYRFISAPVALVGGSASLIASLVLFWHPLVTPSFLLPWYAVLLVTIAANTFFMFREAAKRNAPVCSSAFKHGLLAILPALVSGLLVGSLSLHWSYCHPGAFWSLFYGLALLATRPYAPRSMQVLGWLFFATGLLSLLALNHFHTNDIRTAAFFMGITFGLYHLVYGFLIGRETRFRLSRSAS